MNLNTYDVFWMIQVQIECSRKGDEFETVAVAIRSMMNARGLHFECARVLHESLPVPFLMYTSETMIW